MLRFVVTAKKAGSTSRPSKGQLRPKAPPSSCHFRPGVESAPSPPQPKRGETGQVYNVVVAISLRPCLSSCNCLLSSPDNQLPRIQRHQRAKTLHSTTAILRMKTRTCPGRFAKGKVQHARWANGTVNCVSKTTRQQRNTPSPCG